VLLIAFSFDRRTVDVDVSERRTNDTTKTRDGRATVVAVAAVTGGIAVAAGAGPDSDEPITPQAESRWTRARGGAHEHPAAAAR
jgi:hypothetical protein